MKFFKAFVLNLTLLISCNSFSASEEDVQATAMLWINGISLGDADYMLSLYAPDAILHGTLSPVLRDNPVLIREYFAGITNNPPNMFFVEPMHIRIFEDTAVNTGNYGVILSEGAEAILMRYSFVYRKVNDEWLIVDHHSSVMPE